MKRSKVYVMIAIFTAMLPVMIWGIVNLRTNSFTGKANEATILHIWFEPTEITIKTNEKANIKIIASFQDNKNIIPQLSFKLKKTLGLELSNEEVRFVTPFSGELTIGDVDVSAKDKGTYNISVEKETLFTGLPDLDLKVFPARITVRD